MLVQIVGAPALGDGARPLPTVVFSSDAPEGSSEGSSDRTKRHRMCFDPVGCQDPSCPAYNALYEHWTPHAVVVKKTLHKFLEATPIEKLEVRSLLASVSKLARTELSLCAESSCRRGC